MELHDVKSIILPAAFEILPAKMKSAQAAVMMLAIGLQESRFEHRRQIKGPARGFWQFERGGGVAGVLRHESSKAYAREVCDIRGVSPVPEQVYIRLEHDDVLAAAFARLLLWTDPKPLPALGDPELAWDLYNRVWRPGKPHPDTWGMLYGLAMDEVTS